MAEEFSRSVEDGLRLAKRIYFGNDRAVAPPKPPASMTKSETGFLPTGPMVYAVINDPAIVDNPDIPSYQPHVHGRCDPPALIPIQMNAIELVAECYLDTALVTLSGTWRLHCVSSVRSSDCRIAVPMGAQGSILGAEVSVNNNRKYYFTQLVDLEGDIRKENWLEARDGGFLKPHIFTFDIPQIDGGSIISVKFRWSQNILCRNDLFSLLVPFTFPDFVNPAGKRMSKKEAMQVKVNAVTGNEFQPHQMSHPLKEKRHSDEGTKVFTYDSNVLSFTKSDFRFSYIVPSSQINGGVLLESPSSGDFGEKEVFCMYLSPGNLQSYKVFRKDIVFVIDISGSMRGKLIEDMKSSLSAALSKLDADDSFSIIAFNGESYQFSSSLELASKDNIEKATEWINMNFVAGGDTNISNPLKTAIEMLSGGRSSVPIVFLVTDGTVENERQICDMVKKRMVKKESISPRIYTFGIGPFCNQYFLRMLAVIGRGQHDTALDVDTVQLRMQELLDKASSLVLANITVETFDNWDKVELYPFHLPDLSSTGPLVLSGSYKGHFPETVKVKGVLADFNNFDLDVKIRKFKDLPVEKLCARDQIDYLTAKAWLLENKELEQKVVEMSLDTGFMSEYTGMTVLGHDLAKSKHKAKLKRKYTTRKRRNIQGEPVILLPNMGIGFGDLTRTMENVQPGCEEPRLPDQAELLVLAASHCCGRLCNHCCCMCCIQCCGKINHQFANTITQLCVGIGCYSCFSCCVDLCCADMDG
ncbi:hypothetical protein HN51_012127 [Arachis hypogaea]|uniref:uncharacterized protein n=1 Tax=Arachis hypogaea TaxID=3818 RepID=UPI000DEC0F75|nr:inter-alpha-trypsin inhibitor heavy chain H5 [Arachis hypogaea]QHO57559.1 Inter alpha-trypsin inhibitor, heavy chain [Arachis hypogaea]